MEVFLDSEERIRKDIFASWQNDSADLIAANNFALELTCSIISRMKQIDQKTLDRRNSAERLPIICALVQGLWLTRKSIEEGLLAQSAPLVRQQIEGMEALLEIRRDRRKDGKTPRINGFKFLGKYYGFLSGVAHLSKSTNLLMLSGAFDETGRFVGNTIEPIYKRGHAQFLFGTSTFVTCQIALDLADLCRPNDEELLEDFEQTLITTALGILEKEGIFSTGNEGI